MIFPSFLLSFFLVSHLLVLHSSGSSCPSGPSSFDCGTHGRFKFPFTNSKTDPDCGLLPLSCDEPALKVRLGEEGKFIQVSGIDDDAIKIRDPTLKSLIALKDCDFFSYFHRLDFGPVSYTISPNRTFFKCLLPSNPDHEDQSDKYFSDNYIRYRGCEGYTVYYSYPNNTVPTPGSVPYCFSYQLPVVSSLKDQNPPDPFLLLTYDFSVDFHQSKEKGRSRLRLILAIGKDTFHP
ncbi:hypothetical protein Vadar_024696 [Vaccinium darrowii]|uniref:Uncharacterized protein n=1 Tax=Vaccinium darrowii TaxID=229202 RepID=A0ACB7XK19_9ERIC|nr:hypothetical protein Vadar_024696 [Vaccinium darrowii]